DIDNRKFISYNNSAIRRKLMDKNQIKYTRSSLNPKIMLGNKHEEDEMKAIEKVAAMESLDPEATGFVEYTEDTFSNVCLVPLYDLHIGGEGMKFERLKSIIEFIKKTPNAICILGGDILDNATLLGATNAHTSRLNPDRALDLAVKMFEPIKDKILFVLAGNHDGASGGRNKDSNMAPAKQFAKRLNVKYFPFNGVAKIRLPLKNYRKHKNMLTFNVFATHGSGNAASKAGTIDTAISKSMNACASLKLVPDLILTGHFHAGASGSVAAKVPCYDENGRVSSIVKKIITVESLSTMQEANTYAVANNMDVTTANMTAMNIGWVKNPLYNDYTKDYQYEYTGLVTKFPVLKNSKNALSIPAEEYLEKYKLDEKMEEDVRNSVKDKTIEEVVEEINNIE
ncbi:MAG: metallophosphoesterase, partial [Clostridiales bacterium]|nr:metallophosphoesterase [Candidatus Apopatousia equi]